MNIGEKVAYLKGLAEGLEISSDSKNGKILKGILDILEDIAASVQALEEENETLEDYITEIDEDLGNLEDDYDKTCGHKLLAPPVHHGHKHNHHHNINDDGEFDDLEEDEDDYDEEDDENESAENEILDGVFEMKCPHCKKRIFIETDEILKSDSMAVECPECGYEIEIVEDESGGCSCSNCAAHHADCENGDETENEEDEKENLKF